ncbi:hypothetical protein C2845_PM01G37400 [Panicum miliaceum]|uniref:Uncharacterized protein n=1 Tax=Panicum miliaceum TaxID=4540 RepID=A0A3L6TI64_PANMI|nr:hypothetical protein C2845_PM01G37400 [Panicum miliaceum]
MRARRIAIRMALSAVRCTAPRSFQSTRKKNTQRERERERESCYTCNKLWKETCQATNISIWVCESCTSTGRSKNTRTKIQKKDIRAHPMRLPAQPGYRPMIVATRQRHLTPPVGPRVCMMRAARPSMWPAGATLYSHRCCYDARAGRVRAPHRRGGPPTTRRPSARRMGDAERR